MNPAKPKNKAKYEPKSKAIPKSAVPRRSTPGATKCTLVSDTREKYVLQHIDAFAGVTHVVQQITTGDYTILDPAGKILVCIERKSLTDYGASIVDGRMENKKKLIALREQWGCALMFLVEGSPAASAQEKFGGVPFASIRSSMFHLMVRDNIQIICTADTLDTARTLAALVKSMDTLCAKTKREQTDIDAPGPTACPHQKAMIDLTKKHTKTDQDIIKSMWACVPGISYESASCYMHLPLSRVVLGLIPRGDLEACAKQTKATQKAISLVLSLPANVAANMLAKVPLVSDATAKAILQKTSLRTLMGMDEVSLAMVTFSGKNNVCSIGKARAANIRRLFDCLPVDTPQPSQGESQGTGGLAECVGQLLATIAIPDHVKSDDADHIDEHQVGGDGDSSQ